MAGIYIESKTAGSSAIGDHLYLIYVDDSGSETVLRAGPVGNLIDVQLALMIDSADYRPPEEKATHGNRLIDFGDRDLSAIWQTMFDHATAIDSYGISYDFYNQNSNSFVASLLHTVGINVNNVLPDADGIDYTPGTDNLLDQYAYSIAGGYLDDDSSSDILWGGISNDTIVGLNGSDTINGYGGDDFLTVGDLAAGFTATDLQGADYFKTYHSEWDDGARDVLSGGEGHDILLTAGHYSTGPFYDYAVLRFFPHDDIADAMKVLDFVDGSDEDFTLHIQTQDNDWIGHLELGPVTLQAAKQTLEGSDATLASLGEITWVHPVIEGEGYDTVYGARVFHQTYGSLLAILYNQNAYNGRVLGFVQDLLMARDPSSTTPWTIYGNGTTGSGNQNIQLALQGTALVSDNDDIIAGNGEDIVYAMSGDDVIVGALYGGGDDLFDGGMGTDEVDYRNSAANLTIVLSSLDDGSATGATIGNDILYSIEDIVGGSGNDMITGSDIANRLDGAAGNDTLIGGIGNDILIGGAGVDKLYGGAGNDTFIVTDTQDTLFENASEGSDTFQSSVTFSIATAAFANIENIILTGTSAINATGNDLSNRLTGNSAANVLTGNNGNDVLDGGAGGDSMAGGVGSDKYYVDSSADTVTEATSSGMDTVYSSLASYTLTSSIEYLVLQGSAINGTGNSAANTLTGNELANQLDGGGGGDTLLGGAGNDVYIVGNTGVTITEVTGEGVDLVQASVTITLTDYVENLTLLGSSAINGTGNAVSNVIIGNDGANVLSGGYGADTLRGGLMADTLAGGNGNDILTGGKGSDNLTGGVGTDTFVFAVGSGADVLTDFEKGTAGTDIIDLSGIAEIVGFYDLKNAHMSISGGSAIITWGSGDQITVNGIAAKTDFDIGDFIFA